MKHSWPAGHNQATKIGYHSDRAKRAKNLLMQMHGDSSPSAQNGATLGALHFHARGSYILLVELPEQEEIPVGKLGPIAFPQGFYAYVGSAMGGVEARVKRHLRKGKGIHWHIDYLLDRALIREIFVLESEERTECTIAGALAKVFDSIPRFGCSDCRCQSHLFFDKDKQENELRSRVIETLNEMRLRSSATC